MKWLLGLIIMVIVLAGIGYVGLQRLQKNQQPLMVTPTQAPYRSPTPSPETPHSSPSSSVNVSMTPEDTETGMVEGKLCYPSEVLPEGVIEAKRLTDNVVFTKSYAGSQQGGAATYQFELETGTYVLRYAADVGGTGDYTYGYHTQNCPTGTETTCGNAEGMETVPVEVTAGETVSDYDLCNFYYLETNEPEF